MYLLRTGISAGMEVFMRVAEETKLLLDAIKKVIDRIGRPVKLMEVCGTHTVSIFRNGIRTLLPEEIVLLSGPGCPVCVTSIEDVDRAVAISLNKDMILATFGDMMRVPGSGRSLYHARSEGADIKIVYSPMDCLDICRENPDKMVVFFGTGFETTSPSVAATLLEAEHRGVENFYLYSCHKLVPPALRALLLDPETDIDGFILPGHVSTIIGSEPYEFIPKDFHRPAVITGFDGRDIIQGILMILMQIQRHDAAVEVQYTKAVRPEGNRKAMGLLEEVFQVVDTHWRGIGLIPESGLELRNEFNHRNIKRVVEIDIEPTEEPKACRCGEVLKGKKIPPECPLFAKACTPENPVGACMVSTEGSCAAYYRYGLSL
jgi:hydrogenase expression/formation protein HypD